MRFNRLTFLLIFFLLNIADHAFSNIKIKYKIENEIITNFDIINEGKYLVSLNNNLVNLSKIDLNKVALNSIIQEKIKYTELSKYFEIEKPNLEIDKLVNKSLMVKLQINTVEELNKYFESHNLNFYDVKDKFRIEFYWNKFIYDKYFTKVTIDKNKLRKQISKELKNKKNLEEYFLREIVFELKADQSVEDTYLELINNIKDNGFEKTANLKSISGTSKLGGKIGWIKQTQLSQKVSEIVKKLAVGSISTPIFIGNGYLILKLEEKKLINANIDIDVELKNYVQKETDRQLNKFSNIYFNQIKKNILINEL